MRGQTRPIPRGEALARSSFVGTPYFCPHPLTQNYTNFGVMTYICGSGVFLLEMMGLAPAYRHFRYPHGTVLTQNAGSRQHGNIGVYRGLSDTVVIYCAYASRRLSFLFAVVSVPLSVCALLRLEANFNERALSYSVTKRRNRTHLRHRRRDGLRKRRKNSL